MTLPTDAEKAYNKIQHTLLITTISKLKEEFSQLDKEELQKKKKMTSYLMMRNWVCILKIGNETMSSITSPIQYCAGSLMRAIRLIREVKLYRLERKK